MIYHNYFEGNWLNHYYYYYYNFEHFLKFKQYNNIILYYLLLTVTFPASIIVVSTFFTLPTLSLDILWVLFPLLSYVMCFLLCGSLPFASHAHTNKPIVLISHPSKLLLNVLQKILEVFLIPELPIEQAGFQKRRGTRDHIANIRWMMERTSAICLFHWLQEGVRLCRSITRECGLC